VKINVINRSKQILPSYSTHLSAGVNHRVYIDEKIGLKPMERAIIKTGLFHEMLAGYEAKIRSRRGLTINKEITILNSFRTIDADYKDEV
jgi:dUTP pyrophosphatase